MGVFDAIYNALNGKPAPAKPSGVGSGPQDAQGDFSDAQRILIRNRAAMGLDRYGQPIKPALPSMRDHADAMHPVKGKEK
jgi:hypothetical protein